MSTPWKNGGGVTREVAVWPPGADMETFDWRISMATVARGGSFSSFPGVDRILTVLEGELTLTVDGAAPLTLDPQSAPLPFSGDVPAAAGSPPRPVTGLNVMTRRGRARASVSRLNVEQPADMGCGTWKVIVGLSDDSDVRIDDERFSLGRYDAILDALFGAGGRQRSRRCQQSGRLPVFRP